MNIKPVRIGLFFLLICTTLAQASLVESLDELVATLPLGSIHGIEVRSVESGQLIYTKNNTLNLLPASIIKSATAIAAYQGLGAEFRYETTISSQRVPRKHRTYQGDLKLTFSGDPSLTHDDVAKMVADLKRKGVREVRGNLWLDNTVYAGYPRAGGTIWDDRNICFAAPSSAVILDRNCFYGWLKPNEQAGKPAYMEYDQSGWHLAVDNQVITRMPGKEDPLGCVQEVWPSDDYEYRLAGCIEPEQKTIRMAFSASNPERAAQRYIKSLFKRQGIALNGRVLVGKPEGDFNHAIITHSSEPLPVLLERVLEKSDNIYSDSILKTLGGHISGIAGSFYTGGLAVREILQEQGVLLARARLVDGSGLSRYNRLAAQDMNEILLAGWKLWGEKAPWLQKRDNPQRWLKTGYMSGVNNMAGYVFLEKGEEPLVFTVILNGLRAEQPATSESARAFHGQIRTFHRAFLQLLQSQ